MRTAAATGKRPITSTFPARLDRLKWSPFHTRMVFGLLPVLSAVLLSGLIAVRFRLPLRAEIAAAPASDRARSGIPARFWVFAGFAVLHGICETVNATGPSST
jgi:hypothetical protein